MLFERDFQTVFMENLSINVCNKKIKCEIYYMHKMETAQGVGQLSCIWPTWLPSQLFYSPEHCQDKFLTVEPGLVLENHDVCSSNKKINILYPVLNCVLRRYFPMMLEFLFISLIFLVWSSISSLCLSVL